MYFRPTAIGVLRPHGLRKGHSASTKSGSGSPGFRAATDSEGVATWFLGMVNFYRRFVRNASWIVLPLTRALKGKLKAVQWTEKYDHVF